MFSIVWKLILDCNQQKVPNAPLGFHERDNKCSRFFNIFHLLFFSKSMQYELIFPGIIFQMNCKNVKNCRRRIFVSCTISRTEIGRSEMSTLPIRMLCYRFGDRPPESRTPFRDISAYLPDSCDHGWIWNSKRTKSIHEFLMDHDGRHVLLVENQDEIMLVRSENWILKHANVSYLTKILLWPMPVNE
jgi:hypothetical protein